MRTRREFLKSATLGTALAATVAPRLAFAGGNDKAPDAKTKNAPAPALEPGKHVLAKLPYAFNALEPYIDAQTMELHHDKHHQGYVNGLNAAELAFAEMQKSGKFDDAAKWEEALAFHASGHFNHVIFWSNMKPKVRTKAAPAGALASYVARDFGSLDKLKAQFGAAAAKVEGNGWGALVWHPVAKRLYTAAWRNHQNSALSGTIPLLVCDVWEHAYYLKYQNKRPDYVAAWWNVVDWADVEARFTAAAG